MSNLTWGNFSTIVLELQWGEGGTDSKLFVSNMLAMYVSYAEHIGAKSEILLNENGNAVLKIFGMDLNNKFILESGKHIVQRVPPTESKGRRQTSVVSVALLPFNNKPKYAMRSEDVTFSYTCGTGPGGQHKNRTASCVTAKHLPTGLTARIDGRDQHRNKADAIEILQQKVCKYYDDIENEKYNNTKKEHLSNRGRGDKVRTYNFIESRVVDHTTGIKTRNIKSIMKGNLEIFYGSEK